MASLTTQQIGIGYLSDHIRKLWPRLTQVESQASEHAEAITDLKQQARSAEQDIATLKSMADTQDAEAADQERRLAELTKKVELLETSLSVQERATTQLAKRLHGEQVKRGKAVARADRAEQIAVGKRNRTAR